MRYPEPQFLYIDIQIIPPEIRKSKIKPCLTKAEFIVFKGNYAVHRKTVNRDHKLVMLVFNGQHHSCAKGQWTNMNLQ